MGRSRRSAAPFFSYQASDEIYLLDDGQRREAAQFYGDAVSKASKDVAHMKKETDLDPLREREDFKKLVAELGPMKP